MTDKEMDKRVQAAVIAAIKKAKICGYPIAYYDGTNVYLEYPNGERKYF